MINYSCAWLLSTKANAVHRSWYFFMWRTTCNFPVKLFLYPYLPMFLCYASIWLNAHNRIKYVPSSSIITISFLFFHYYTLDSVLGRDIFFVQFKSSTLMNAGNLKFSKTLKIITSKKYKRLKPKTINIV